MPDILHRVGLKTNDINKAYRALTSRDGLASWWTTNTTGEGSAVGELLEFRFDGGGFDMKVLALEQDKSVLWEVVAGLDEWIGTKISFELKHDGDYVILLFKHLDWREAVEFMHHCSTKWAIFLMSFKALVETGTGKPAPGDVKIDNWN